MPATEPWRRRVQEGKQRNQSRQGAQVVRVEPGDDIATICGRVDVAPTQAVVLQVWGGNAALATELGMRRLSHFSEESGKAVAVATQSPTIAMLARRAGIPVSRSPASVRWDTGPTYVPFTRRMVRIPSTGGVLRFAGLAGIIALVGLILLSALPQGSVTLAPPSTTLTATLAVTASPERDTIDFDEMALPAREVATSHRLTLAIPTTGTANVGVGLAEVAVAITNPTDSAITIPGGATMLGGPQYLPFVVAVETDVPAGATVRQLATAAHPGVAGNLPAGTNWGWFEEDLRVLRAQNAESASGGTSEERPGIAAADIERALEQVRALRGAESLKQRLVEDRPGDLILLRTATITVDHEELPAAGSEGDVILFDVDVTIRAFAVLAPVLEEVASHVLPIEEHKGILLTESVLAEEPEPQPYSGGEALVRTTLVLRADIVENFHESDVKKLIRGKSPSFAQTALAERYQAAQAEVKNWPSWAPYLPRFDFRLSIKLIPGNSQPKPLQASNRE